MRYTVLEIVQDLLSSMDSDEVNSIDDTVEAQQVATIVKTVYNDIVTQIEFPDEYTIFQLDPSLDSTKPVVMYLPKAFNNLEWLKYNKKGGSTSVTPSSSWTAPDGITVHFGQSEASFGLGSATGGTHEQFRDLVYLPLPDFLTIVQSFDSNQSNVISYTIKVNSDQIPLLARKDKQPDYFTHVDNRTILFDSYDSAQDDTLQASKTLAYGKRDKVFYLSDNWVIDLDAKYTSLLFNEAKALCFSELKQVTNTNAEKKARKAMIKTQKSKHAVPFDYANINNLPNYGRRRH